MLQQGLKPTRIAVAADSAGGGLTVATLVAIRDAKLPLPAAEVMWLMLQLERTDCVVVTGANHSVRTFLEKVIDYLQLDWKKCAATDPGLFRPAEVDQLIGDATKAREVLGWRPKVSFDALVL